MVDALASGASDLKVVEVRVFSWAPLSRRSVVQVPDFQAFCCLTSGSVSQSVIQNHAYLIRRNGIFYFSRRVPADVRSRFNKDRVIVSLHTRSLPKAQRSSAALSDRLERYWNSIRLEVFHTRELGLSLVQQVEADRSGVSVSVQDALDSYLRLKGAGRSKTFFKGAERAVGYLT